MARTMWNLCDINDESRIDDFHKRVNEIADKPHHNWWLHKSYRRFNSNLLGLKRFYISDKKYYIMSGQEQKISGITYSYDDFLAVDLIEVSTKKRYFLDVAQLLEEYCNVLNVNVHEYTLSDIRRTFDINTLNFDKLITVKSQADINRHVYHKIVNNNKTQFGNKEFADAFIDYVGDKQIYFMKNDYYVVETDIHARSKIVIRPLYDVKFVKNWN